MDKRGIEITFSWIFITLAGSIILLFFIYFAWKQVGLFNTIGVNEVVANINNEIDAFSIGVSSNKVVKLPGDVSFTLKCGEVFYKNSKKDTQNLIYGKGEFRDSFNLWTKEWVFPFKIDNFYFAGDLNKKIYVIGNENFLFNIPDNFKTYDNLNKKPQKEDIIIDFSNSNLQSSYKNNKVIVVDKDKSIFTIYPENQKEEFYSDGMLLGAIFSDFEDYKCLKKKASEKLGLISELYKKKSSLMKLNSKCLFLYNQIEKTLGLFEKEPLKYKNNLVEQNNQLKRDGCPNLF